MSGANSLWKAGLWHIVVLTAVGQIALTVMFLSATSMASVLTSPTTPHLAAM